MHIDAVNLSDRVYKLTPARDSVADLNLVNLTEPNQDPNQHPEEPKAFSDSAQEGKPRCIFPYIFAYKFIPESI